MFDFLHQLTTNFVCLFGAQQVGLGLDFFFLYHNQVAADRTWVLTVVRLSQTANVLYNQNRLKEVETFKLESLLLLA